MTSRVLFVLTGIVASAGAFALAQDPAVRRGTVEPPLLLFAEHGGAEVAVALDQPVTIGGATFTLRARGERLLRATDFSVEYPRNYHFEYEVDELHMWTLTGASASLMLFVTQQRMQPQDFLESHVEAMAARFAGSTISPATITLEGKELRGKRVLMTIGSTRLSQEAYAQAIPGGRVLMIVLQDSPGEQAETAEVVTLRALVSRTFARTN